MSFDKDETSVQDAQPVELYLFTYDGVNYTIRYIKEPSPIILDNLSEDIDIKGKHTVMECELHPALHKAILDRAVQLAIASKTIVSNTK